MTKDEINEYNRLERFLYANGKSGWIRPEVIITRMAILLGLDPKAVIVSHNVSERIS